MHDLSPEADSFLAQDPKWICTVMGFRFYACPFCGDEVRMIAITPAGTKRRTPFLKQPTVLELGQWLDDWS